MRTRRTFLRGAAALALGLLEAPRPGAGAAEKAAPKVTAEGRKAAAAGLEYLAREQLRDGSFGTGNLKGNVAVTGLGALALAAGGHLPDGPGEHRGLVRRALDFVLAHERNDPAGYLLNPTGGAGGMYSHGFGLLFLAKLHGHVPEREAAANLKAVLERAVALTVACQNQLGGWRYAPFTPDADLSVTGTQVLALRAARDAGLKVSGDTMARAAKYALASQNPDGSFRYVQQAAGAATLSLTALGLDVLFCAGQQEKAEFARGLARLRQFLPTGDPPKVQFQYYYGHLHAARVLAALGGELWSDWYAGLGKQLLALQRQDGSWPDSMCPHYGTALACLLLLMPDGVLFGA